MLRKTKKNFNVQIQLAKGNLTILINGLPHIKFAVKSYIGFQSWYEAEDECFIEFYFKDRTILCKYNHVDKWKSILWELDKIEI